jgi:hypothetical protein
VGSGIAAFTRGDSFSHGGLRRVTHPAKVILAGIWLPGGVRVGRGVSEVLAAFWANPAGHCAM